ncbi:hypothetical protein V8E53_008622 [Lactarius tabidus]
MSIVPGSYNIANAQSGLVFHLSEDDNRSIVANPTDNSSRQLWVLAPVNGGGWTVQSVQTGQSIGFVGAPQEGVSLVVGDSSVARPWAIGLPATGTEAAVSSPLTFKISLVDSKYVVQSPNGNTDPGTPVQLSAVAGENNQLWAFRRIDD